MSQSVVPQSKSRLLTVSAPAKLNLGLRVLGRRDDGYHLLESLFVPLEIADRLVLQLEATGPANQSGALAIDFEMSCDQALPGASMFPPPESNLVVKAARSYFEAAGLSGRASIRLEKLIPVGAGLGGGSSDAGAVLRALDAQHPGAIPRATLFELAARLGADVPFFLAPEPSFVRGIGDQISVLRGFPEVWLLLVNPGVSLATAVVFETFDRESRALTLAPSRSTMRALEGPGAGPLAAEKLLAAFESGLLVNDLEPSATVLCPLIGELQERLRELGARFTAMSGSGATTYGVFANEGEARSALERAKFKAPIWACVTRTWAGTKN